MKEAEHEKKVEPLHALDLPGLRSVRQVMHAFGSMTVKHPVTRIVIMTIKEETHI